MKNLLVVSPPIMGASLNANGQGLKTNALTLNFKRQDISFSGHLHKSDCNFYKTATL